MKEALIKVAVYGTLMSGERNEHWAANARSRVPCTIKGWLYDTGWGFPAFVPDEDGMDVTAELLEVTPETLARMDVLEGYPRLYWREKIKAKLFDGRKETVLVYVMNSLPANARKIIGASWNECQSVEQLKVYTLKQL